MAKKRSRQGASRPLRRATPNDPPGAQPESYTPADLPDTIPDARRRYALWQAGMLKTKVDAAIESRSEEHTSELQSRLHLVCRLLLEKKKKKKKKQIYNECT